MDDDSQEVDSNWACFSLVTLPREFAAYNRENSCAFFGKLLLLSFGMDFQMSGALHHLFHLMPFHLNKLPFIKPIT